MRARQRRAGQGDKHFPHPGGLELRGRNPKGYLLRFFRLEWWKQHVSASKVAHFMVALVIAAFLWFLNKMNHEYTIDLTCQAVLQSPPLGLVLADNPEQELTLRIRGNGYSLLRYRGFRSYSPLIVDIRGLRMQHDDDTACVRAMTREELEQAIRPQLPTDLTLERVLTEGLVCHFSRTRRRVLPLRIAVNYEVSGQYMRLKPDTLFQDSIWVLGPASTVDTLRYIANRPLDLGVLQESTLVQVPLEVPPGVELERWAVDYGIRIAEFTIKRLQVPVQPTGLPRGVQVRFLPSTVELRCRVPLELYDRITAESFTLQAHISDLQGGNRLLVQLADRPSGAQVVTLEPQYVDYLILR